MKSFVTMCAVALVAGCRTAPLAGPEEAAAHPGAITLKGAPLTLLGNVPAVGSPAPDARVVDAQYSAVRLSEFRGKPLLLSVVPSLDTSVCSLQTKRFNEDLAGLPAEVVALTISMDLPYAQKRFCEAAGISRMRALSDVVDRDFGRHYGVLIKERGLLARSIFVIGRNGTLRYAEIVPELSQPPDYAKALEAVRQAVAAP
jgi:thiol peroxidase